MDQMFDNQATINNLQTAYDICLNARYTYEFWLTDQFRFANKTELKPGPKKLHLGISIGISSD